MTEQEIETLAEKRANRQCSTGNEFLDKAIQWHIKVGFISGYQAAMKENERLKRERDAYKKVAEEWMNDYDKLKNKYEPMVAVTSEGETK